MQRSCDVNGTIGKIFQATNYHTRVHEEAVHTHPVVYHNRPQPHPLLMGV